MKRDDERAGLHKWESSGKQRGSAGRDGALIGWEPCIRSNYHGEITRCMWLRRTSVRHEALLPQERTSGCGEGTSAQASRGRLDRNGRG